MRGLMDFFERTPVSKFVSSILMMAMAMIMVMNVILRYCFHFSFNWGDEIIRYFCIYMSFLGIAASWRFGVHIGVTLFVEKLLPETVRKYVRLLSDVVTLIFLAVTVYFGFILVERIVVSGQSSPALKIPMYMIYGIVPISGVFGIIQLLIQMLRHKSYRKPRE